MAYSTSIFAAELHEPPSNTTTMSYADAQRVFNQQSEFAHVDTQNHFANQFDLENPEEAMSSYQKYVCSLKRMSIERWLIICVQDDAPAHHGPVQQCNSIVKATFIKGEHQFFRV